MKTTELLHVAAFSLVVIGALNWGLVALWNFNLVTAIFGPLGFEDLAYVVIGASALYVLYSHRQDCKTCLGLAKKRSR